MKALVFYGPRNVKYEEYQKLEMKTRQCDY